MHQECNALREPTLVNTALIIVSTVAMILNAPSPGLRARPREFRALSLIERHVDQP
jgi:hypothetical protein